MANLVACPTCGLVQRMEALPARALAVCCRCGAAVARPRRDSLGRVAAYTLAALILYLPANLYPILEMRLYGAYAESTIWDGCVSLFRSGQWLVAGIVFLASIVIPLAKLLGLGYLVSTSWRASPHRRRERAWIHRLIGVVGPWAMLDVYLMAVLVALVKLDEIATILPGPGLLAFTAVVVCTILASASFDRAAIWDEP